MAEQKWHQRYAEGIVISIISTAVIALVAFLYHIASPWFGAIFYGTVAGSVVLVAGIVVMMLRRLPRPRVIPSEKNIESCVRLWLDNNHFSVQSDPKDDLHFRLTVTGDSGKIMTIFRSKGRLSEYVEIQADLGIRGDSIKLLDFFSAEEKEQLHYDILLELARAKIGYAGFTMPPENFYLFRRVPILPSLTEFYFLAVIGDVEAAVNLVVLMFRKAKQRADARTGGVDAQVTLPSTSDTPVLEPPKV